MKHLAEALDAENPEWRTTTVILLDNASYHKSSVTMPILKQLELPIMYSGSYSFNIAACELFFSRLKQGVLAPNDLPLGKK